VEERYIAVTTTERRITFGTATAGRETTEVNRAGGIYLKTSDSS
jgi:hypothetical protein